MLELKDVRFSVTDEKGQLKNIINGINLKIDEGKFVAITGPNGSVFSFVDSWCVKEYYLTFITCVYCLYLISCSLWFL